MSDRKAEFSRKTSETEISAFLNIDGMGNYDIDTGIGFFDHMLKLCCKHGLFDANIKAKGDLYVDFHHTVEDTGIVLGKCFDKALGDKRGINRYGSAFIPMDEALAEVIVDISGRPFLVFDADFKNVKIGDFDAELIEEFFRAFCMNSNITMHCRVLYGNNNHHKSEALFKALGKAINEAVCINPKIQGVMSTKDVI